MNECNIVRDLLPLWADDLVSEDTVAFITRHGETCPECREAMKRYREELPSVEVSQPEKKTLRSLRWELVRPVFNGIVVFMGALGIFMGLVYYWFWENEYLPIQKSFPSADKNYGVDMVDWDTAGFWDTGEGSRVYFRCGSSTWATYLPWDDLDVVWAPDEANCMLVIQTVTGEQEYRILEMRFTRDEVRRKSIGSHQIIPDYRGPDLQSLLTEKCKAYSEFPKGWEDITFTFTQWESDSETVIFHFTTDTQNTGFVSYHFPTETITKLYN